MDVEFQQRPALGCELVAEVVRSFGEVRLKVTGGSMLPAIWPGDVITVRRRDLTAPRCRIGRRAPAGIVRADGAAA